MSFEVGDLVKVTVISIKPSVSCTRSVLMGEVTMTGSNRLLVLCEDGKQRGFREEVVQRMNALEALARQAD